MGNIYLKSGYVREAIGELKTAIYHSPEDPLAHYHLSVALTNNGSTKESRREYMRALACGYKG
jgi:Tfp pilus assembly protein PilF